MKDETYNGEKNYETWNVRPWLTNDEGSYHAAREAAKRDLHGDAVKDLVEEMRPDLEASMFADILGSALSRVDWREVRDALAEE